jgi:peroxiredoxin
MALTPSTMLSLGTQAPDFSLPDACSGGTVSLSDFKAAKGLLVMFICNHCPYVIHIREDFGPLAKEFESQGLKVVAINANDLDKYPQDGPPNMKALAEKSDWQFPYLMDEDQSVAKAYQAACTPDFFLFDAQHKLAYRGQWDDSSPGNNHPVNGASIRSAVQAVLNGDRVQSEQIPAMGCNIKWKAGNAPAYFG